MSFKFPFTNYHELNLTWVLDQLKKLLEDSAENVSTIETYEGRLTAVETELPLVSETAQDAAQTAASAATLAQQAKSTADTAQKNAIQAQAAAGQARQEAQGAQTAANAATQAAQQAQATAQNFDGRITQAENDASQALEASRSFENRVQSAITTANNAAQTATNAQGIATRADQNAALALDTLRAQRSELERIGAEQAALITEETESGKTEIEDLAQSVLESIPADYTTLSALVDKKSPVIINSASGSIASFDDGAENMKIQKLVVNIEPVQAGSGDPSPTNIRPISGHTGANVTRTGKNLLVQTGVERDKRMLNGEAYNYSGYSVSDYIPIRRTGQLIYFGGLGNSGVANQITCYDKGKQYIGYKSISSENPGFGSNTLFENTVYVRLCYETQYENLAYISYEDLGRTDIPEGHSTTIPVTFPDTIYGGEYEVISGKLKSTMAMADLGDLTWIYYDGGIFRTNSLSNLMVHASAVISDEYKYTVSATSQDFTITSYAAYSHGNIVIRDSRYTNAADFKAASVGKKIVYELAEQVKYTLTGNEINTIYGANNVWSDTGDTSVEYCADTKLYIDGKLVELQATILENI